jgi:hypothetical protein
MCRRCPGRPRARHSRRRTRLSLITGQHRGQVRDRPLPSVQAKDLRTCPNFPAGLEPRRERLLRLVAGHRDTGAGQVGRRRGADLRRLHEADDHLPLDGADAVPRRPARPPAPDTARWSAPSRESPAAGGRHASTPRNCPAATLGRRCSAFRRPRPACAAPAAFNASTALSCWVG